MEANASSTRALGALADGHHGTHRGHANDSHQGGEERAHLVAQKRAHRDPQPCNGLHGAASAPAGMGSARSGVCARSDCTRPSCMTTTREA